MSTVPLLPCDGCRRRVLATEVALTLVDPADPAGPRAVQCPACRGYYAVVRESREGIVPVGVAIPRAREAMHAWWDALADRDGELLELWWQPDLDGLDNPDAEMPLPLVVASTQLPGDMVSKPGRDMLAAAANHPESLWPLWWNTHEPMTWWLWASVDAAVGVSEVRGPITKHLEVRTAATDYGDAGDPLISVRASASVACAWWSAMLRPIHRARVAVLRAGVDGVQHVPISPDDRQLIDAPHLRLAAPGFAFDLGQRAEAAERILDALASRPGRPPLTGLE
jgi:hypothetical protein